MSALHAVRVAARCRKELGLPVEERAGRYGEFTVLLNEVPVVEGGSLGWLGVLPSSREVLAKLRAALAEAPGSR